MATRYEEKSSRDAVSLVDVGEELRRVERARIQALTPISQQIAAMSVRLEADRLHRAMQPALSVVDEYRSQMTAQMVAQMATFRPALLQNMAPMIQDFASLGAAANVMVASQLRERWKPTLMRWAPPTEALLAARLASMSDSILAAARPMILSAATQFLEDTRGPLLHQMQVHVTNLYQPPTIVRPGLGEDSLPYIPPWPQVPRGTPPPDSPPMAAPNSPSKAAPKAAPDSVPSIRPGLDSSQPLCQCTKEDLAAIVREEMDKQKPTLARRVVNMLGDKAVDIVVVAIAVKGLRVDDGIIYVCVESVHVVVEGISYILQYLP